MCYGKFWLWETITLKLSHEQGTSSNCNLPDRLSIRKMRKELCCDLFLSFELMPSHFGVIVWRVEKNWLFSGAPGFQKIWSEEFSITRRKSQKNGPFFFQNDLISTGVFDPEPTFFSKIWPRKSEILKKKFSTPEWKNFSFTKPWIIFWVFFSLLSRAIFQKQTFLFQKCWIWIF